MLLSGVALAKSMTCKPNCQGTNSKDTLTGRNESKNEIRAAGGDDLLKGLGRTDWLFGDNGDDDLVGGASKDGVYGGNGNDAAHGNEGGDYIVSATLVRSLHSLHLRPAQARSEDRTADVLDGGPGDDTIDAVDGNKDRIDCGPGNDTAYIDAVDKVTNNCENVPEQWICPSEEEFLAGDCPTPPPPSWAQPPSSGEG